MAQVGKLPPQATRWLALNIAVECARPASTDMCSQRLQELCALLVEDTCGYLCSV